jgi:hypothetical protein
VIDAPRLRERTASVATAGVLVLVAACVGVGLTAIAAQPRFGSTGPLVMIALSLFAVFGYAVLEQPRWALVGVFALFPIAFNVLPSSLVRFAVIAIALLVGLERVAASATPFRWSPTFWWAVALLVWLFVDLPSALDPHLSLKEIIGLVSGLAVALIAVSVCRTGGDVRWALGAMLFFGVVVALLSVRNTGTLQATAGGATVQGRTQGAFGSPNQLGSFCALVAFVAAALVFGGRTRKGRIAATLALAPVVVGLTLSLSRGAWIGTFAALVYLLLVLPQARRALLVVAVTLAAVAVLTGGLKARGTQVQVITQRLGAIAVTSPYDQRTQIWHEAVREIKASPWTGVGPGNFPLSSVRAASSINSVYAEHAHNIWLTWAAESGLPAAALVTCLMIGVAHAARRARRAAHARRDRRDEALVFGLQAALITVLAQGFVDYTLRNAVVFAAVWTVIGLMLVLRHEAEERAVVTAPAAADEGVYDAAVHEELMQRERRLGAQLDAVRQGKERLREREAELDAREAELAAGTYKDADRLRADLEERQAHLRRVHDSLAAQAERLSLRAQELEERERALPVPAVLPVGALVPEVVPPLVPEPEPVAPSPPPVVSVPEPEPPPLPPPVAGPAGAFNVFELERLVRARAGDPAADEWNYYLLYLRDYASVDGELPAQFDGLVWDVFGPLVGA